MYKPWHDEARKLLQQGMNSAQIARKLGLRYMTVYLFCNPQQREKANAYYTQRYAKDPAYREYKRAGRAKQHARARPKVDLSKQT